MMYHDVHALVFLTTDALYNIHYESCIIKVQFNNLDSSSNCNYSYDHKFTDGQTV